MSPYLLARARPKDMLRLVRWLRRHGVAVRGRRGIALAVSAACVRHGEEK